MPDSNSILNGEAVTFRRGIVGKWDGDGTYSDQTVMYGVTDVTFNLTTVGAQRNGDGGALLASYRRITGGTISLTFAGDMSSLGVLLGITPAEEGVTPDAIRALRMFDRGLPYVGIAASFDLDTGDANAVQLFAAKCQVNSDTIAVVSQGGGAEAEFRTVTVELVVLPDENFVTDETDEVQSLTLGTPTTGTYTLTVGNYTTSALAFGANAAAIETALEALPIIRSGNVTVTGTGPYVITYTGELAGSKMPLATGVGAGGFDGTIAVTRTTAGVFGRNLIGVWAELEGGYAVTLPPVWAVV